MSTITHKCPTCGDVHLSPSTDAVGTAIEVPHVHTPEKRGYLDLAGDAVYRCTDCGARVTDNGIEWKPRGNYPWG